jgi:hypothetical protein
MTNKDQNDIFEYLWAEELSHGIECDWLFIGIAYIVGLISSSMLLLLIAGFIFSWFS